MTVRIEDIGCVFYSGMKFQRQRIADFASLLLEKLHGVFELAKVGELQPKGSVFSLRAQSQRFARRQRKQAERMMFGVAAEKQAAMALPRDFFAQRETEHVAIESFRSRHIVGEQINRSESDDLERPREQNAVDIVGRRQVVD